MLKVNYDEISKIYDHVRHADIELLNSFLQEIEINTSVKILDIGCGTGNYTGLFQKLTQANVYGLEPSDGMLNKARQKNNNVVFKPGQAENIPFEDDYLDFVYMTDVIHHVSDIDRMFAEIYRILKKMGKVSIVTQSHKQIANRPIVQFFPGTAVVDKERYPDIAQIIATATAHNLTLIKVKTLYEAETIELGLDYLELVTKKGYSMLHLISDEEYERGLNALKFELRNGTIRAQSSGLTLVWFIKE